MVSPVHVATPVHHIYLKHAPEHDARMMGFKKKELRPRPPPPCSMLA